MADAIKQTVCSVRTFAEFKSHHSTLPRLGLPRHFSDTTPVKEGPLKGKTEGEAFFLLLGLDKIISRDYGPNS
ncbi:MAG: hypothetical protein O3A01_00375 [bacterium]|nr:hypothetical protein [bacterium]